MEAKEVVKETPVKQVQIRRRETNSINLPAPVVAAAKKNLGSHFVGRNPLRALTIEEEKKWLPRFVDVDVNTREWEKAVKNYWAEFKIPVPSEGVVLTISLGADGEPHNLEDYIAWRWASIHKLVAKSEKEMLSNPVKQYYIYDPEEVDQRTNQKIKAKKDAYREFIKLTHGGESDRFNRVFRIVTGLNPASLTFEQKENRLDKIVSEDPDRFHAIVTDKKLEVRSELAELIEFSVLRKVGNHILWNDDKIGESTEEAILFLESTKNTETLNILRAQLAEKKKVNKVELAPSF